MNFGPPEFGVLVLAVLVVFGAKKLPEIARSMGRAKTEFRKGLEESEAETARADAEAAAPKAETKSS